MSKCHIVGNHMSMLNYVFTLDLPSPLALILPYHVLPLFVSDKRKNVLEILNKHIQVPVVRDMEIPCPTCLTWSHFIQDKLKISIYLSLDKCKICIKLIKICISYFFY